MVFLKRVLVCSLLLFICLHVGATSTYAASGTVTFDDVTPNQTLTGQYPSNVIDWGTSGSWIVSAPWQSFTTNSVSFHDSTITSASFTFVVPSTLVSVSAYNGDTSGSATITIACSGNTTVSTELTAGQVKTISTNWTNTCTTVTITSSNGWGTNFDSIAYTNNGSTPAPTVQPTTTPSSSPGATAAPGTGPLLVFHKIVTDSNGKLLPWYSTDPATAYDKIISLVWNYWVTMPNEPNGVAKYLEHRMMSNSGAIGGDQVSMALSSWQLLYQYNGDQAVKDNMVKIADFYLNHSLSPSSAKWPNIPYPANDDGQPAVTSSFYYKDVVAGAGVTQPDKAGSFGAELVTLYKMTGNQAYLTGAINIANTLSAKTVAGDANNSPLPFRVNAVTGAINEPYTSNWTPTLRLFDDLIALNQGNVSSYSTARSTIIAWLKKYPLVTHGWGPFFEDISGYSDTEINADTLALYILEHPSWGTSYIADAKSILDQTDSFFGNPNWDGINWTNYGVLPINEQTQYVVPGNSHTARHASTLLMYAEKSGDTAKKARSIRDLSWATYMVDNTGANLYPTNDIWLTDGYGDYVRHYLRAMAAAPELAPSVTSHILRSTSVIKSVSFSSNQISYVTFDPSSTETLKMSFVPQSVTVNGATISGWSYDSALKVLKVPHMTGTNVVISSTGGSGPTPTPVASACQKADINQDTLVDISDYSILVANFFKSPLTNARADVNGDGVVDISDYSLLVQSFFKSC